MGHNQTLQYLIDNEQDARWGLTVNGVGFQHIDSDEPYPPKNHPQEYSFLADQGRRLNEYQFIYITAGRGFFQSEHCAQTEIKEGDMFLLFPREWHRYHPDPGTGWNEYWIGFRGQNIDSRIANGFFSPREPVFHVGLHDELVQVFRNAIAIAKEQYVGYQQMLAGAANMVMGHAYAFNRHNEFENHEVVEQMRKAKVIMTERLAEGITPMEVAEEINMGYSRFRQVFRKFTGYAPLQYIQEVRLTKCKQLLANTNLSLTEIAYQVGYESVDYFATTFRKKNGVTPTAYRKSVRR